MHQETFSQQDNLRKFIPLVLQRLKKSISEEQEDGWCYDPSVDHIPVWSVSNPLKLLPLMAFGGA